MSASTDKSLINYQSGEYLQFQRSLAPETASRYVLGTLNQPFYMLHAQQLPLAWINTLSTDDPFPTLTGTSSSENNLFYTALVGGVWRLYSYQASGTYDSGTGLFSTTILRWLNFATF